MNSEDFLKPRLRDQVRGFLDHWAEREARPRIACSECQFEYVEEDGHDCGQGQVQAT